MERRKSHTFSHKIILNYELIMNTQFQIFTPTNENYFDVILSRPV